MKKNYSVLFVGMMLVMSMITFAQTRYQFDNSGFEDWSGAQFNGSIQPSVWHCSNVSQVGQNVNFAHRTTGRTGSYAMMVQDQFVGLGAIGATSPGYASLGTPWSYISGLNINGATAGTYGGMAWTTRPDSMVIWVKRYYDSSVDQPAGDHTGDENFNILYYSWSGTSHSESFKNKQGGCTTPNPEQMVDEESDIRLALDGNECPNSTRGQATQIAEGWYKEMAAYGEWTRVSVPIYYFNDDTPEKCNVIISAGNYPNFRANDGLNAGNSLAVDDIELIYSSAIQKLFIVFFILMFSNCRAPNRGKASCAYIQTRAPTI